MDPISILLSSGAYTPSSTSPVLVAQVTMPVAGAIFGANGACTAFVNSGVTTGYCHWWIRKSATSIESVVGQSGMQGLLAIGSNSIVAQASDVSGAVNTQTIDFRSLEFGVFPGDVLGLYVQASASFVTLGTILVDLCLRMQPDFRWD